MAPEQSGAELQLSIMAKSDNTPPADKPKRKAPRTAWKPGQSGNPKGAPKDGESWAAIIKEIGDMPAEEVLKLVGKGNDLGRAFAQLPKNVAMKKLVVARIFAALMFEPSSGLLKELMDRVEGKVKDQVENTGAVTLTVVYQEKKKNAG